MKVSDYIVDFLIQKGIKDIYGYPGAVVCHLMDSALKSKLTAHLNYHEQGSAFAACGYAQSSGKTGVAYANVGPGATNLLTGIANAWFDSISTIFIAGQVDTTSMKGELQIRQRGIQETNAVDIFKSVTKYSVIVDSPLKVKYCLEKAYHEATTGRLGPVFLEIPADVQRAEIDIDSIESFVPIEIPENNFSEITSKIILELKNSKKPCLLVGNGIKQSKQHKEFILLAEKLNIPVVFSLPAFDILPSNHYLNFGFIGSNGNRYSNFILGKSDLIISIGSRMDIKQVGTKRGEFALNAKIIRIDIDKGELGYKVREDEVSFCADLKKLFKDLNTLIVPKDINRDGWISVCNVLKDKLAGYDFTDNHRIIREFSKKIPEGAIFTLDVGQHMIHAIQALIIKERQKVLMSTGLGSMGYSIPAAIGAYYGARVPIYVICGDGGFQMNMQELQFISKEKLPIKIIVINNNSLGMIREFQERNFEKEYMHSVAEGGYTVPNLEKLADVYNFDYWRVLKIEDVDKVDIVSNSAAIIEVVIDELMYLNPRLNSLKPIQDMNPPIDRDLYDKLMEL